MNAGVTWWTLAWRTLWRDARAGELRLLVVAVALGVVADVLAAVRPLPLAVAALAASSSCACSRVRVSAVVPSGREAFTFPCFT